MSGHQPAIGFPLPSDRSMTPAKIVSQAEAAAEFVEATNAWIVSRYFDVADEEQARSIAKAAGQVVGYANLIADKMGRLRMKEQAA